MQSLTLTSLDVGYSGRAYRKNQSTGSGAAPGPERVISNLEPATTQEWTSSHHFPSILLQFSPAHPEFEPSFSIPFVSSLSISTMSAQRYERVGFLSASSDVWVAWQAKPRNPTIVFRC